MDILTLQSIDDEAATFRAALADAERRLLGDTELDEARTSLAGADVAAREVASNQRRVEDAIASLGARITPEEKRLYDGSVKNPKELSNIQHEVELLRVERSKHEDELLEVLAAREQAESALAQAKASVAALEDRWEQQQSTLERDVRRLNSQITAADAKREAQKAKIPPRSLFVYEDIRKRRGGMAVARIQGGSCGGCRVQVPDAIRRRAFSTVDGVLALCPNCERILYVG